MSDILSKLKALGVTKGMPDTPKTPAKNENEQKQLDILLKTFPNGLVVENDHGYAFINRLKQPLSQPHGQVDMADRIRSSSLFDSMLEMQVCNKEDTLAFDTETSGLSNASGTFIFMNGLGYFEGDSYIVDQLILPDIGSEPAFLRQTELIFSRFPILLSYNGKSFDVPLLQSRLRFHMFPDFTRDIRHIDLLKLTRRYWKTALGTVPLSNIEHYLLRLQRGDEEVPGYLAPELYRSFLRDEDASHIAGVAYHNQIDVVSLSAFLLYFNDLVIKAEQDPSLWKLNSVSENALMRYNLPFFTGKVISEMETFTDKEKKSMASKLMRSGETEQALSVYKELASRGDYASAEKLMEYYRKHKDQAQFETYRELAVSLIEQDVTLGKWSKAEKLRRLSEM